MLLDMPEGEFPDNCGIDEPAFGHGGAGPRVNGSLHFVHEFAVNLGPSGGHAAV